MNGKMKNEAEKSLKSFLKRKVAYTAGLLVAFLITGAVGLASSLELASTADMSKEALLANIAAQKAEVQALIDENEKALHDAKMHQDELVRKGDFYAKPVYGSTQIFFGYGYDAEGKAKDKTKKEWKNTLNAIAYRTAGYENPKSINPYAKGEQANGLMTSTEAVEERLLDPEINGNIPEGMSPSDAAKAAGVNVEEILRNGNGVYSYSEPWEEKLDLGANIKPLDPTLPTVGKTVDIAVSSPTVTGPTIGAIPNVTPPAAPADVNVTVTPPAAVAAINVTPPTAPNPQVPGPKTIAVPTVATPTAVDPTMIVPPETPSAPVILPITIDPFTITTAGSGNNDGSWFWNTGGENGIISQIIMESGTWNISNFVNNTINSAYDSDISNYTAHTPYNTATTQYVSADAYATNSITNKSESGTSIGGSRMGIYRIVGSPYSSFENGTTVNIDATTRSGTVNTLRQFVHFDPHGEKAVLITDNKDATANEKTKAQDYYDIAKANNGMAAGHERAMFLTMKGDINLKGNTINIVGLQGHSYGDGSAQGSSQVFAFNSGNIKIEGIKNAGFAYTSVGDAAHRYFTFANHDLDGQKGTMTIEGAASTNNALVVFDRQASALNHVLSFFNDGIMEIKDGTTNTGIFVGTGTNKGTIQLDAPIILSGGTKNVGVYHAAQGAGPTNELATQSVIKVNVTGGTNNVGYYAAFVGQTFDDTTNAKPNHEYNMIGGTSSTGVYALTDVDIGTGKVVISGGTGNVGLYTATGDITSKGSVELAPVASGMTSAGNVGTYATAGRTITFVDAKATGTSENNILMFSDGGTVTNTGEVDATGMTVTGAASTNDNNTIFAFTTNNGAINIANTTLGTNAAPDISITGMACTDDSTVFRGVGLMVANGGTITATAPLYVKVSNGAAGVASVGANSKVILAAGSTIWADNGYAAYTNGMTVGGIDLTNSNIVLDGTATAFDYDPSIAPASQPIITTGLNITVDSDNVIVFNIKNASSMNVSGLAGTLTPSGVTVTPGAASNYKEAAVDGINGANQLTIDVPLDKAATSTSDPISFYYYNRFIAQNSKLDVNANVTANLNSTEAANFKNQVIALEMNASKNSTTNADTQINIAPGVTVAAARTDAGNGGVGAFINYGLLTNKGTIEVQNGYTTATGATAIYATNGSAVLNDTGANINTYGEKALGVYATPWRTTTLGGLAGAEFGAAAVGQGNTTVVNKGNITTNGAQSVGIYMDNNSADPSLAAGMNRTITGTNDVGGVITVGDDSIAMYAKGNGTVAETHIGNNGTLVIGKNAAGMYGENSLTIDNIGDLTLGEGAIGIVLDPNSVVAMGGTVGAITTSTATGDKAVIAINGVATGAPVATTIGLPSAAMNLQGTDNVTALYAQGVTGATNNSTDLKLGNKGVGVYVNNGDASNAAAGVINIDAGQANAVGMYTANGTVINNGTINVNDPTGLGMVASTATGIAINNLNIALGAPGATGIYANQGATVNDAATGNITFAATPGLKAFGIVADGATVNLDGGTKTIDNSGANIYTYAMNGSTVNINGNLTIDGVADADPAKSVGIYLDGTNSLNNVAVMTAMNAAVGVYVNGPNTLTGGTYVSDGDKTVGIYMSNGGTLDGLTINAQSPAGTSAIGAYVAGGTATIANSLTLNIGASGAAGTGMYFANGSNAAGAPITITNGSTDANVGLYYTGGAATHSADINMTGANMIVGLYADAAGTNVTNANTITDTTTKSVGAMASNGATVTNAGTINTDASSAAQSVGMYTETGNLVNTGTINVTDGLGAALVNAGGTFNGAGGNITVAGAGAALSLDATVSGQVVDAGTMNITGTGVGVYAKNGAIVDFPMIMTGTSGTGVYAKAGTTVTGTVDGSGSSNTIGLFTEDATVNMPSATIKAGSNGIGWYQGGAGQSYATAGNTIEAAQPSSIGVYVAAGNSYASGDTINAGTGGIGVLTYGTFDTNGTTMNIDGSGIGIVAQAGSTANIGTTGAINVTFTGNGGILSFANGGTINLGSLITTTGSGTISATLNGSLTNTGTISIENGAYGLVGSYDSTAAGYAPSYTIANTGDITVKSGAVGMAAVLGGGSPATTDVTVSNSGNMTVQDANSVGMYASVGNIANSGSLTANDNGIGVYATGAAAITDLGTINVTKGVGYVTDGVSAATAPTATAINLNAGDAATRSIGGYYLNTNGTIAQPANVNVLGEYTIGMAVEGGTNTVSGNITDNAAFQNTIGMMAKASTTTVGDVTVNGNQNNIGVFGDNAALTTGNVTVVDSNDTTGDKANSSIGVYINGGSVTSSNVTVGKSSLGLFGKNGSMTVNGNIAADDASVGAYVDGDPTDGVDTVTVNGNITAGKNALGTYGKDANVAVTGDMNVANGLGIGIVSTGDGDVSYSGTATVADKGTESASIAIYKGAGSGTVNTTGTFNIGEAGYAVYADNKAGAGTTTVNNAATINLGKSAVGIYAGGNAVSNNTGNITVGESYLARPDHKTDPADLNSVGMYGELGAQLTNSGTITADKDHSVGVYVKTSDTGAGTRTLFTNTGNINVDNGGVGVLAVKYADVINEGTITVNETGVITCGGHSVGVGVYSGSTFTNAAAGEVTINGGYGVFIGDGGVYTNKGNMTLNNGAAVVGKGTYNNEGTVIIGGTPDTSAQAGKVAAAGEEDPAHKGAISISNDGKVVVNNQYIAAGQLVTDYAIVLDKAQVDITKDAKFVGDTVSGTITLTKNFITEGNGYSWTAQDFIGATSVTGISGNDIKIKTSPLYMAHMSGSDLLVAKQPYAYLVAGSQFDNLYNGVDSLLALDQAGTSKDSQVLKQLNGYLEGLYDPDSATNEEFFGEASRTMAEMRGDIYATIKGRMNRVQNAFDKSFDEMLESYNFTRDTGKFSVIYTQGKYKDDTVGIDDYKYKTTGLMYMHEYEGRNYASKWGYTLGFGVSRFDFDDSPTFNDKSKEDVYSLRAGLHNVHSFGEDDRLRLVSKLELGWNRHEAERTIELDQKYKNDATYDTFNVSLDNRLEKTLYRSVSAGIDLYGEVDLEYAKLNSFTEDAKGDSGLELKIKGKDYFSAEAALGIKGYKRAYLGKKMSLKLSGDIAYAYEFGDNYSRTKAKVVKGTEGYYNLIKPDEEEGKIRGIVGLTLEKANNFGVTVDAEIRKGNNKKDADIRYSIRANYKF